MPTVSCAEDQELRSRYSRQINFITALRGRALEEYLEQVPWYAMPNDLIGGWCIMPVPLTPGAVCIPEIADFLSERGARHIASLHNAHLEGSK